MDQTSEIACDLMIVGAGMTGMAAALFAAENGICAVQAGMVGGLNFASGLMDLMGVHPVADGRVWDNPWDAIDAVRRDLPKHPYSKIRNEDIRQAFDILLSFLSRASLDYRCEGDRNIHVATPAGTVKTTYCVPATMIDGAEALEKRVPALIVDFEGLKGFGAAQIVETLKSRWPGLQSCRIRLPDTRGELFAEQIGRMMEVPQKRKLLADLIIPLLGKAQAVGMPAVLGINNNEKAFYDLREKIGRTLFEIPTMPPSITGFRLMEVFKEYLPPMGVRMLQQHNVRSVEKKDDGDFVFQVERGDNRYTVRAKAAVLATGRFFGRGLRADRTGIRETVFDLPVYQEREREKWRRKNLFDPRGHHVNHYGLETDDHFRPVDASGRPIHENLFAAGAILAHQDWIRMKCGTGLAVATAFAAIKSFGVLQNNLC